MNKFDSHQKRILAIVLAIFVLLISILVFASNKILQEVGPSMLSQDSTGRIWVYLNKKIYIFDQLENQLGRVDLEKLGILPPYAGMASFSHDEIIIGSRKTKQLYVININGSIIRKFDSKKNPNRPFFGAINIYHNDAANKIYVTDTSRHRVFVLNEEGEVLQTVGESNNEPGMFHFPNGIYASQGKIYVVDTNHHMVQIFSDDMKFQESWKNFIDMNSKYIWPVHITADQEGHLYVTVLDDNLRHGEIVRLKTNGEKDLISSLPKETNLSDIVVMDNKILVSDAFNFKLFSINQNDMTLSDFGDASFEELLKTSKKKRALFNHVVEVIQWFFKILLIVLLIIFFFRKKVEYHELLPDTIIESEDKRPVSLWVRLEFYGVLTLMVSFQYLITLLLLAWVYAITTTDFLKSLAITVSVIVIIVYMLGLMFLGSFIFAVRSKKGIYHPLLHEFNKKILQKFGSSIQAVIPKNENISSHGMALVKGFPTLVLRTLHSLVILSLNPSMNKIMRIQKLNLNSIATTEIKSLPPGSWNWILGISLPLTRLIFYVKGLSKNYCLDFMDYSVARNFQQNFGTIHTETSETTILTDLCVNCFNPLLPNQICSHCDSIGHPPQKTFLFFLYPGIGQFIQKEFFKGILFLISFTCILVSITQICIILFYRSSQVSMPLFYLIIFIGLFIWIFSIFSAVKLSKKTQYLRWGL